MAAETAALKTQLLSTTLDLSVRERERERERLRDQWNGHYIEFRAGDRLPCGTPRRRFSALFGV